MTGDFQLFICRRQESDKSESLLKRAAVAYGVDTETVVSEQIIRSEKGKPYFKNLDIHFSISHTRDVWAVLMGPARCGLDVQYIKPCAFRKIAGRFFSLAENRYVDENGLEGFFDIWTSREACGKFSGEGFFGEFTDFVTEEGQLADIIFDRALIRTNLQKDLKCAWCVPLRYLDSCNILKIREDF